MDSSDETSESDQEVCKKIVVEAVIEYHRGSDEQLKKPVEKVIQTSLDNDDIKDSGKISLTKEHVSVPKDKTKEVNSSCLKRGRPRKEKVSPDNFKHVLKNLNRLPVVSEDDLPFTKGKFLENKSTYSDIIDRLEFEKFTQKEKPNNRQKEKTVKKRKYTQRQKTEKTRQSILPKAPIGLDVVPEVSMGTKDNCKPKLEKVFHQYMANMVNSLEILEELAEDIPRLRGTRNINAAKIILQQYL